MTAFFCLFFIADFFWCLRRSGFVVGARENGLGARPNFLYAGKTLVYQSRKKHVIPTDTNSMYTHHHVSHTHTPPYVSQGSFGKIKNCDPCRFNQLCNYQSTHTHPYLSPGSCGKIKNCDPCRCNQLSNYQSIHTHTWTHTLL